MNLCLYFCRVIPNFDSILTSSPSSELHGVQQLRHGVPRPVRGGLGAGFL